MGIEFKDHEYTGLRKDGSTFPILIYTSPIIRDEKTVGLRGIILDITQRKLAEEALRESEEKYRSLVSLSPDPIVIIQDGRHKMVSSAFTKLFGYTQEDIDKGLDVLELIQDDYKKAVRKRLEDRFAGKKLPRTLHTDMIAKDGRIIPCESSGTLIQYGGQPAVLVIIRDITERKKLDKILIHREKLKTLGAIAAEVAHEIRNPLTSLGGFAQRLKQKYPDSYECDIIISETQRLENILSRIRNYLEPVDIYPKECSINAIITSCAHLLSPETESREIKCVLDLDRELPDAYADPGVLAQIIINLIRNATEATEKGGTLFIKSFEGGQDLYIEFKNRVLDMKHEDPETLFMPFADGGKSVGLPLCYRLLKDMGGLLSFIHDRNFMVFTVSLPKTLQPMQEKN